MTCCNRHRAQLTVRPPATAPHLPRSLAATSTAPEVALRYTGARRVRVEGVVSGRIYCASPTARLLSARPEDVRSLLRSGLFVRA